MTTELQINTKTAIFTPSGLQSLLAFAEVMARGHVTLPAHLAGNPADCLAITLQSAQWEMNPFAVAQKTHVINGILGYEAQLINAVVSSSTAIKGRFHYEYSEKGWEKVTKSKEIREVKTGRNGSYEVTKRVRDWTDSDEQGLCIRVGAILRGESEITWGEKIHLSSIVVRNSPLWATNPKQQIAYLAVKYWARLYCPDVILGVYTPDELDQHQSEIDITPSQPVRFSVAQLIEADTPEIETESVTEPQQADPTDAEALGRILLSQIETAVTCESIAAVRSEIELNKALLGSVFFTELKNAAVNKYKQIKANKEISDAINSVASLDDLNTTELLIERNTKHLTPQALSDFKLAITDLRVEFSKN